MGQLIGKTAIMTGAGSGIGRSCALRFAREGARVGVADLTLEAAQKVVDEIQLAGGEAIPLEMDVANEAKVNAAVDLAPMKRGHIDVLGDTTSTSWPSRCRSSPRYFSKGDDATDERRISMPLRVSRKSSSPVSRARRCRTALGWCCWSPGRAQPSQTPQHIADPPPRWRAGRASTTTSRASPRPDTSAAPAHGHRRPPSEVDGAPRRLRRGRPERTLTTENVLDFLRDRVASGWMSDEIRFIDAIPKTSVGKFDKKVLRVQAEPLHV